MLQEVLADGHKRIDRSAGIVEWYLDRFNDDAWRRWYSMHLEVKRKFVLSGIEDEAGALWAHLLQPWRWEDLEGLVQKLWALRNNIKSMVLYRLYDIPARHCNRAALGSARPTWCGFRIQALH